jgi:hypothetical protein
VEGTERANARTQRVSLQQQQQLCCVYGQGWDGAGFECIERVNNHATGESAAAASVAVVMCACIACMAVAHSG